MKTRVLLADDHQIVRESLRSAMEREGSVQVVGEAENGRLAVDMALELAPEVVLMDIHMPGLNGTEATRQIKAQNPGIKVLILSMYSQKQYVMAVLKAGASGFLQKNCSLAELLEAIAQVANGKSYLSPEVAGLVIDQAVKAGVAPGVEDAPELSPRERQVVQLVAEGHSGKSIAEQMHISESTVDTHRRNIMLKLGLKGVAELTKYAVREGIVSLEG